MSILRPTVNGESSVPGSGSLEGCSISTQFPHVVEFLCPGSWGDGTTREPGSVTLFWQDGKLKVCLKTKTPAAVCFLSASSITSLFLALEQGLVGGTLDWRADRGVVRRKA